MFVVLTRLSVQGGIVERLVVEGLNRECHALKLDRDHWLDIESGEIREYEHGSTRADAVASLRRTFRNVRALINANCSEVENVRWITLTYAENMTDTERLYRDFHSFWKRFKRRWSGCEYIIVVEPQKRGAWHIHMLAIWGGRAPFVPNDELRACWGHGFVRVTALDGIDNVGAYLSAYLGDVVLDDGESPTAGEVKICRDGTSKRVKKGARLSMYPAGMQICRHSRGIRKPEQFWVDDAEKLAYSHALLSDAVPVYSKDYTWKDSQGRVHVTRYEQYNLARGGARDDSMGSSGDAGGSPARVSLADAVRHALDARTDWDLLGYPWMFVRAGSPDRLRVLFTPPEWSNRYVLGLRGSPSVSCSGVGFRRTADGCFGG